MNVYRLVVILYLTLLSFSSLYLPQPLLPVFVEEFGVSQSAAALTTTLALLPLAVAPIFYGMLLESFSAKKILFVAVVLMGISDGVIFLSDNFFILLGVRLFQGCLIPAMLTSIMAYISTITTKDKVQNYMALYVVFQILGGFLGRFFSGTISAYYGWRFSFLTLGVSLLIGAVLIIIYINDIPPRVKKLKIKDGFRILKDKTYMNLYISIFCSFFVFASIMNFLPFRLNEIGSNLSSMGIGAMYTGFLMGALVSLNSVRIVKILGSEFNAILIGHSLMIVSLVIFYTAHIGTLFFSMFILCAGMFLIHSVSSGYLNKISSSQVGIVNGIYVSAYYFGGSSGSFFPGYLYEATDWGTYLVMSVLIISIGIYFVYALNRKKLLTR